MYMNANQTDYEFETWKNGLIPREPPKKNLMLSNKIFILKKFTINTVIL